MTTQTTNEINLKTAFGDYIYNIKSIIQGQQEKINKNLSLFQNRIDLTDIKKFDEFEKKTNKIVDNVVGSVANIASNLAINVATKTEQTAFKTAIATGENIVNQVDDLLADEKMREMLEKLDRYTRNFVGFLYKEGKNIDENLPSIKRAIKAYITIMMSPLLLKYEVYTDALLNTLRKVFSTLPNADIDKLNKLIDVYNNVKLGGSSDDSHRVVITPEQEEEMTKLFLESIKNISKNTNTNNNDDNDDNKVNNYNDDNEDKNEFSISPVKTETVREKPEPVSIIKKETDEGKEKNNINNTIKGGLGAGTIGGVNNKKTHKTHKTHNNSLKRIQQNIKSSLYDFLKI